MDRKRIYQIYSYIKCKCSPTNKDFKNCSICDEWKDFENFLNWFEKQSPKENDTIYCKTSFYSPETCCLLDKNEVIRLNSKNVNVDKKIIKILKGIKRKCSCNNKNFNNSTICDEWASSVDSFAEWLLKNNWNDGLLVFSKTDHYSPETCELLPKKEVLKRNRIKTNLKKYGVEHSTQSKEVKDKIKKTNFDKYGVENVLQVKEVKEKIKKTRIENGFYYSEETNEENKKREKKIYAILNRIKTSCSKKNKNYNGHSICDEWKSSFKCFKKWMEENNWDDSLTIFCKTKHYSPENCILMPIKEVVNIKTRESSLKKYGVEHHLSSKEVKEKRKKTNLERYGVESVLQSEDIQKKIKENNIKKYGVENPQSSEDARQKAKKTNLEKYGSENPFGSEEIKNKIRKTNLEKYGNEYCMRNEEVKKRSIETKIKKGLIKSIDGKLLSELSEEHNISYSLLLSRSRFSSDIEYLTQPVSKTNIEIIIEKILNDNNIDYVYNRSIGKYRPDFLVNNLIIECNGNYWHSDACVEKTHHQERRKEYIDNGYKPLFFFEDEIIKNTNIVQSIIFNKLNMSERIYARKCNVVELDTKTSSSFFEENHLMGRGKGKTFALCSDNQIFSAIRIVKKRNGVDISRFCHKIGYNVVGGFSKLLSHISKEFTPEFIETFIDLRYGSGDYLPDLGFEKQTEFLSFTWTNSRERFHRMKFPNNSGYENGLNKVWDCGQARYKKLLK